MENKSIFGLIGRNISYSFSQRYFTEKFRKLLLNNHTYQVFDLENLENIKNVFQIENIKGLNVTIPYKEKIIHFLDELSPEAQKIGAVNTILIKNGKTIGYNTDTFGFEKTLLLHKKNIQDKALVLGDGGAAKAVKYVLDLHQIPYKTVSRTRELNFDNLPQNIVEEHKIIVQCTPVGTFPNVEDCLKFPFESLSKQHLVIDLIYNPEYTQFIKKSAEYGAKSANGFYMLEQQAEKSWEIWNK